MARAQRPVPSLGCDANQATGGTLIFEPILTRDSYQRLIDGGPATRIEFSFQPPKDPSFYKDLWTQEAAELLNKVGAVNAAVKIGVGRTNQKLAPKVKNSIVALARSGLARVARIKLEEDQQAIDLIAERVVASITVPLEKNGRATPEAIYAALLDVEGDKRDDIKSFYGN